MKTTTLFAAMLAATLLTGTASIAEDWREGRQHYIVTLDEKMAGGDVELQRANTVIKVDCFAHDDQYHYVISAKGDGFLAAYLAAKGLETAEIRTLPVKWQNAGFDGLDKPERLAFAETTTIF